MKKITHRWLILLVPLFSFICSAIAQPTVSAPTPAVRSAAKVISIFSDAYTNVTGTDFNPNWGQATQTSIIQLGTDNILKYASLSYQGTQFGSHVYPAGSMTHLHLDVWTADETSIQLYPICWNGSANEAEKFKTLTLTQNSWNSFDIPLTDFTSQGLTMTDVYQFKIVGTGGKTIYLDNIYFYDNSTAVDAQAPTAFTAAISGITPDELALTVNASDNSGVINYSISYGSTPVVLTAAGVSGTAKVIKISGLTPATLYTFSVVAKDPTGNQASNSPLTLQATTLPAAPAAPVPSRASSDVIAIYSDAYTCVSADFYPWWDQTTIASEVTLGGAKSLRYSNFNYMGIALNAHIDASAMSFLHIDVYPTSETTIRITPISPGPKEYPFSLGTLTAYQWNGIDIPLSSFTGVSMSDIFQFKLDGGTGNTFYMDNLYFYKSTTTVSTIIRQSDVAQIYPNVVADNLHIVAAKKLKNCIIRNVSGQTVYVDQAPLSEQTIHVSTLIPGQYFIFLQTLDGEMVSSKFIKK